MRAMIFGALIWAITSVGVSADPKAMQSVIDRQIEAFKADDFAAAMEYASPGLQRYFQTPEVFGRMVTQGYPMVWRPGSVRYLEDRVEGGIHWQRVMIEDMNGTVHILDYKMLETDAGWRINGVQILDSADFTT